MQKYFLIDSAKTRTKITPSVPFTEILPITIKKRNEHIFNSITLTGEILGVNKVQITISIKKTFSPLAFHIAGVACHSSGNHE